jgi:hypothetical protein
MTYGRTHEADALAAVSEALGEPLVRPRPTSSIIAGRPDAQLLRDPSVLVEVKCPITAMKVTDLKKFYASLRVKFIRDGALNLDNEQGRKYHRQCQLYLLQRNARKVVVGVYAPKSKPLLLTVTPDPSWREEFFRDNEGIKATALALPPSHGEESAESNGETDPHEEGAPSDWCGGDLHLEDEPDTEDCPVARVHSGGCGTPDQPQPESLSL